MECPSHRYVLSWVQALHSVAQQGGEGQRNLLRFSLDLRERVVLHKTVVPWSRKVVPPVSLEGLRPLWDKTLSNLVWPQGWACSGQWLRLETSAGPCWPEFSSDLMAPNLTMFLQIEFLLSLWQHRNAEKHNCRHAAWEKLKLECKVEDLEQCQKHSSPF